MPTSFAAAKRGRPVSFARQGRFRACFANGHRARRKTRGASTLSPAHQLADPTYSRAAGGSTRRGRG
ncbi:MAG TPA: hypothetical protein VF690_05730, partial [Hymenobacter sp.]